VTLTVFGSGARGFRVARAGFYEQCPRELTILGFRAVCSVPVWMLASGGEPHRPDFLDLVAPVRCPPLVHPRSRPFPATSLFSVPLSLWARACTVRFLSPVRAVIIRPRAL